MLAKHFNNDFPPRNEGRLSSADINGDSVGNDKHAIRFLNRKIKIKMSKEIKMVIKMRRGES